MVAPPTELVRRALQRAVEVARAGEAERPVAVAPAAVRPLLRFKRLPVQALVTIATTLDTDDEFRTRVAAAVDRDDVGRVAWLWLTRPDGWQDELAQLLDEIEAEPLLPAAERDTDKALRRRMEGAERAAARAADRADRAENERDRLRSEMADAVSAREVLDARVSALEARLRTVTDDRRAAVADLKRVEGLLTRRTAERHDLEARVAELESTRDTRPPSELHPGPSNEELRLAIDRLARLAEAFVEELAALGSLAGLAPTAPAATPVRSAKRRPSRRPVAIPGGLSGDSGEAAVHLLERPTAVLLVDGYNVSMYAWADTEIAQQRTRLERMLSDLAARTPGLTVELVFDGAEVMPLARPGPHPTPGITVRFTPPDVEADDALLELADGYPHDRPVIVASNDRRVRDGARRRGANVLSAEQLLAVLGGPKYR